MAVQFDPIAKDESLNTTEQTTRNIADVLAQELSGIANAITGGDDKAPKTDIATVEPGNTASRAYSVGELVYVNGNLYKVITAIASGATFTVDTNIQSTNVSDAIARPHFKAWESIPNFSVNGDRWTATSDGFVTIRIADTSTTTNYVYVIDESLGAVVATVTLLGGAQGATFANSFPVRKGVSYRLRTDTSMATFLFMPLDV